MPRESRRNLLALVQTMRGRLEEPERDLEASRTFDERLRDSEERFRQVTDNINEVFWMTYLLKGTFAP